MIDLDLSMIQWAYTALAAPVLGWIAGRWSGAREAGRKRRQLIAWLSGLPIEAKELLIDYWLQSTHTQRLDPNDPMVELLCLNGAMTRGPGGGTYDAIDRYMTITPAVWEVLPKWIRRDYFARNLSRQEAKRRLRAMTHKEPNAEAGDGQQHEGGQSK